MSFELRSLPPYYQDESALEPYISKETLQFHYDKHHRGYVNKLNELVKGTEFENLSLEDVIKTSYSNIQATYLNNDDNNDTNKKIFNNAAQVWNHDFYWQSMIKDGGGAPDSNTEISKHINTDLGGFEKFKESFIKAGEDRFGSGWVWLVMERGKLKIITTINGNLPLVSNQQYPLLVMDVWEHAYYIDQRNARRKYIDIFINNLINWNFAEENLLKLIS